MEADSPHTADQPYPKLRWFQYRLRSLLLMPVVCGLVCWWYVDHRRVVAGREEYESALAVYEAGTLTMAELFAASKRLCEAEERSPFVGRVRARARHLLHINSIEMRVQPVDRESDPDRLRKRREELARWRAEAQRLLEEALGPP